MLTPVQAVTNPSATAGEFVLVLAVMLPFAGAIAAFLLGRRLAEQVALVVLPLGLLVALSITIRMWDAGHAFVYVVGGWTPPLGVALRADGFSALMLSTTAVVICATGLFARADFAVPPGVSEARAPETFWTLLLGLWGALNTVFLANDLFNLFVALELLTFSAVPLVSLEGRAETLEAALRYLLFALLGSVLYLLGTVLLYGTYATLDIGLLSQRIHGEPVALIAGALMTVGLLAKTALFPLHLWLPPAHAGAPPAASAVLSGLVVKGSFFLLVRIWFDVMPGLLHQAASQLLAALGAGAIIWGSVLALRQPRLKLLIAYSTIAQIGYLFLMFPLAVRTDAASSWSTAAWIGGLLQAASHAFAKAAMFLGAGLIAGALGHDRIVGLSGIGKALPITVVAFGLAGLSLMGVPPSGGFLAKWQLLTASVATGQWWWALVMLLGGVLAGGYVFRVVAPAFSRADEPVALRQNVPKRRQIVVLALAICSILLGLLPLGSLGILLIGRNSGTQAALSTALLPADRPGPALAEGPVP